MMTNLKNFQVMMKMIVDHTDDSDVDVSSESEDEGYI